MASEPLLTPQTRGSMLEDLVARSTCRYHAVYNNVPAPAAVQKCTMVGIRRGHRAIRHPMGDRAHTRPRPGAEVVRSGTIRVSKCTTDRPAFAKCAACDPPPRTERPATGAQRHRSSLFEWRHGRTADSSPAQLTGAPGQLIVQRRRRRPPAKP
jgi:hypothetical protein